MKALKVTVSRNGTGFKPLAKSTPSAVTRRGRTKMPPAERAEHVPAQVEQIAPLVSKKKLRVCCYCRVSTMLDSQETSIEGQRDHYETLIRENPEWEYAGIYLEAGVSGTKAEIRPELQRLIADCKAGKIDLILTKSVSRFARNTSDCLEMVRLLTSLGVAIHFEKEQIHTDEMHSEFMLSLLACLAEDESRSISGNMKWGIQKRFRDGSYRQALEPYGYKWDAGTLVIVPEEAEVVKEIFSLALKGMGCPMIAKKLNRKNLSSVRGRRWSRSTIYHMIKNPVYTGDILYQKTYTDETFRQRKNSGEMDQYLDEAHHEGIISREEFEKAQAVIRQRGKEVGYGDEVQKRSSGQYCFSSILFCKECGAVLHRQPRKGGTVSWQCGMHSMHPDLCRMKPQNDADLRRAFLNCLNKISWSQNRGDGILDAYETMLGMTEKVKSAERLKKIDGELAQNREEMDKLTAEIMRERFLPEHREKKQYLENQARELLSEKNSILTRGSAGSALKELKAFISGWKITDDPGAFPEEKFTEFVDHCTVSSGEEVTFHFKCGLDLTESLYRSRMEKE